MKNLILSTFLVLVCLYSNSACSETVYVHSDILGSPIMETNSSGTVTSRSHYKPFGEALEGMKKGVGYTGHLNDKDLELTYMQARYYDPVIGRFYSNDPASFSNIHNFNRYAYANNNPYKFVDPDGNNALLLRSATPFLKSPSLKTLIKSVRAISNALGLTSPVVSENTGSNLGSGINPDVPDGDRTADDPLPRDKNGNPVPESDSPHTQLGTKKGRKGSYPQGREFGKNGEHVKDIDFTDHGRDHPNPHEHPIVPNETGGTPKRGPAQPLNVKSANFGHSLRFKNRG